MKNLHLFDRKPFDIRDYQDRLDPTKQKHRYECPVCGGHALTINPKNGAYKCWSNECASKDIREAIAPELFNSSNSSTYSRPRYKRKPKPPAPTPAPIPPGEIELAQLPHSPTPTEPVRRGSYTEIKYPYSPTQWVLRKQNPNGKKITLPYHTTKDGEVICGKGEEQWQPYRWNEILQYGSGKWVLAAEGEKDTDNSRIALQIVSFTFQGGSWSEDSLSWAANQIKNAGIAGIIIYPDNDNAGARKASKLGSACAKAKLPFITIDPVRLWQECPPKGDISDWIGSGLASIEKLNQEIATALSLLPEPKDREITREQWYKAKTCKELLEIIPKLKQQFTKKKQPWGFEKKKQPQSTTIPIPQNAAYSAYDGKKEQLTQNAAYSAYGTSISQPQFLITPTLIYKKVDRAATWINSASQYIFDSSGTGSGKSYDAGRLQPYDFDCQKIFYVSNDSRNPTTPTLQKDWAHLEGRHNGLVRDEKGKIRRKKSKDSDGEQFVADSNCGRNKTITAVNNANIKDAYSANIVCHNCAYLEACNSGVLFGYRNARAKAFNNSRIISHPQSLPTPNEDFDYSNSVIIWEEWGEIFKNSKAVTVTARDVDMLITTLATENSELLISLLPLLTKIKAILSFREKAPSKYGWSWEHLQELLEIPENIDLAALEVATAPSLIALNPTEEYGVDIADLPAGIRKKFQERDDKTAEQIDKTVLKQWILPLISVLSGESIGYISADFSKLTITTPNNRLAEIAASAKKNIFLDATGRTIELAQLLNIPHTQIFKCKQEEQKQQNLEIIQVGGLGRMGISRGDDQQKRGKAVIAEIKKKCEEKGEKSEVITFKKFDGKYQWFVDSRGSNDLEGIENIILDGIPTANLEALKAEFTCINNRAPITGTKIIKQPIKLNNPLPNEIQPHFEYEVSIDDNFADFIRHRILQTINQAIGRNRSSRYPDKQFKVYILGDYPLDVPVTLVEAKEITPEAATKIERLQMAMKKAVEQLKSEGKKVTQEAVAKLANVSQQRVSQLREFLLVLLKGDLYTKTSKNNSPPKPPPSPPPSLPPDGEWVAKNYLPLIALEAPEIMLEELSSLLNVYSLPDLLEIWQLVDGKSQIDLLSTMFGCIPDICQVFE